MSEASFCPLETLEQLMAAAAREGLRLTAHTLDTMGLDFLVAHARDASGVRWIVRSPRRADVVAAAAHEARVLAVVRALPVAVPEWRVHAPDVIAYRRLDGTPAVTLDGGAPVWNIIDPAAPSPVFVASVADAIAALQALAPDGIRSQTLDEERATVANAFDVARPLLDPPDALWARWQRWLHGDTWPTHTALVHGDLHPGHMLLADDGRLVGILDWTEAHVGDPSIDLAMFHQCFGREALEALVARFPIDWPVEHAIERAAAFPALAAAWGARTGNDAAIAHARSYVTSP